MLNQLKTYQTAYVPNFSDQIFELFCYFKKIEEFKHNGKTPLCISTSRIPGVFRPHFKPGWPRNADYFQIVGARTIENRDLILNGKFEGISGIFHSPDIALTKPHENKVITFYECKNYSGRISPGVYREFIGYCKEMGVSLASINSKFSAFTDTFSVMTPCLYTSGFADIDHIEKMKEKYNLAIRDHF